MNREADSKRTFCRSLKWGSETTSTWVSFSLLCCSAQGLVEGSGDTLGAHLLLASGAGSGRVPVWHRFLGFSVKPWIPFPASVSPPGSYLLGKMYSGWALNSLLKWEENVKKISESSKWDSLEENLVKFMKNLHLCKASGQRGNSNSFSMHVQPCLRIHIIRKGPLCHSSLLFLSPPGSAVFA